MTRIDQYWNERFGLTDELDRPGVHVVPHARYRGDDLVLTLVKGDVAVLGVDRSQLVSTRQRVRHLASQDMLDLTRYTEFVDRPISHCVGPLYEGYADEVCFTPASPRGVIRLDRSGLSSVRAFADTCSRSDSDITPVWREVLDRFVADCDSTDVEQSGVARADSPLFGVLDQSTILALAHYSMWAHDAASMGVLTHPEHRGRGYGKAAVSAAMADAFSRGFLVLYRTLVFNRASVALATSVGCHDYGRFLAVHLETAA